MRYVICRVASLLIRRCCGNRSMGPSPEGKICKMIMCDGEVMGARRVDRSHTGRDQGFPQKIKECAEGYLISRFIPIYP